MLIVAVVIIIIASGIALAKSEGDKKRWQSFFEVITLKVVDHFCTGTPTKVAMLALRVIATCYDFYAVSISFYRLFISFNTGEVELAVQWSDTDTEVTKYTLLAIVAVALAYFLCHKYEPQIEAMLKSIKVDTKAIKEDTTQLLVKIESNDEKLDQILRKIGNNESIIIASLTPQLKKEIQSMHVVSASETLDTLIAYLEENSPTDKKTLSMLYYYKATCGRYTRKEAKDDYKKAYSLMQESGEPQVEILQGMIYVCCEEKKYKELTKYSDELCKINPTSIWIDIIRLVNSDSFEKDCQALPDDNQKIQKIANAVMLGSNHFDSLGVDINTYEPTHLSDLTYENFPIWMLNLSVALTRFTRTLTLQSYQSDEQKQKSKLLFDITDKYLQLINKTQLVNPLKDVDYIHAYSGFQIDKDSSWIEKMGKAPYSKNHKEIYYLCYANMLVESQKYEKATEFLKTYGDEALASILHYRLVVAIKSENIDEYRDVFSYANSHQTEIADHLLPTFLGVVRRMYQLLTDDAKHLNIISGISRQIYHQYLAYCAEEIVDTDFLLSHEAEMPQYFIPYVSEIYKEKINTDEAIRLLEPIVDKSVFDIRLRLLIDYLASDNKYTIKLYHLLQEVRKNGIIDDELLSREHFIAEKGIGDFKVCLEISRLLIERHPDDESVILNYLIALSRIKGNDEEIKSFEPKVRKICYTPEGVRIIFDIYHIIGEHDFALEYLYQQAHKTNEQTLRDLFYQKTVHPDFQTKIMEEPATVGNDCWVRILVKGEEEDVEIASGSIYDTLIGKKVGDKAKLDYADGPQVEVLSIHNKYFKLMMDVMNDIAANKSKSIRMYKVNDFNFESDPLGALMKMAGVTEETRTADKLKKESYQR